MTAPENRDPVYPAPCVLSCCTFRLVHAPASSVKIAASGDDAHLAGVARCGLPVVARTHDFIGMGEGVGHRPKVVRKKAEPAGLVLEPAGNDMDDFAGALDAAAHQQQTGAHHDGAEFLQHLPPHDDIAYAHFILEGYEDDPLGGARALAHQHDAGNRYEGAGLHGFEPEIVHHSFACAFLAQETHRMAFERHP